MVVRVVRGAVQIQEDRAESVEYGVGRLVHGLMKKNSLVEEQLISIQFTITEDLQSKNPAGALRRFGFASVPLFCSQEPKIQNMLPRIDRVLVTVEKENGSPLLPLYIDGAEKLRPDLL